MFLLILPLRADADCFQYLTGVSGSITSLNYPNVALTQITYTTCVRREVCNLPSIFNNYIYT